MIAETTTINPYNLVWDCKTLFGPLNPSSRIQRQGHMITDLSVEVWSLPSQERVRNQYQWAVQ